MLVHSVSHELLARQRALDFPREADRDRLVRLATANRASAGVKGVGILTRIRQAFAAAQRSNARPSVNPAG